MARAAEGVHDILGVSADDVDLLIFGFAVGFNAKIDGHSEEVEVLVDLADGTKSLIVPQPVDGVLVGEGWRTGAIDPLTKERSELFLALGFGNFFKVGRAQRLVSELAERSLQSGEKRLVTDLPAQHVKDHRALLQCHRLELRREGIEAG